MAGNRALQNLRHLRISCCPLTAWAPCRPGTEGTCITHMLGRAVMARLLWSTGVTSHSSHTLLASTMSWGQTNLSRQPTLPAVCGEEKEQCRVTQPAEDTTLSSPERAEQASMHPASSFDHTPEVLSLEIRSVIFKFSFSPNIFFPNNSGKPSEWSPFFPPRTFSIFSAGLQIAGEIVSWAHCFYYFKFFFFFF